MHFFSGGGIFGRLSVFFSKNEFIYSALTLWVGWVVLPEKGFYNNISIKIDLSIYSIDNDEESFCKMTM